MTPEHTSALDFVRAARELGAHIVAVGDVRVEFPSVAQPLEHASDEELIDLRNENQALREAVEALRGAGEV